MLRWGLEVAVIDYSSICCRFTKGEYQKGRIPMGGVMVRMRSRCIRFTVAVFAFALVRADARANTCCQYAGIPRTCATPSPADCATGIPAGTPMNNHTCDGNSGTCKPDCLATGNASAACDGKFVDAGCGSSMTCQGTGAAPINCTCARTSVSAPAVSDGGILVLAALLPIAVAIKFGRRRVAAR